MISGSAQAIPFDFDNGNFIRDLITTHGGGGYPPADAMAPGDVGTYTWLTHLLQTSWFDALAPYHPTAVGVYSRIPRRPASESATNRNKNIAGLHAMYQVSKVVFTAREPVLRHAMSALGLDPDDESQDPATAVGIGNRAGKAVVAARLHDGMNVLGDKGRRYNGRPFEDYTGYRPVNTPYKLVNPSRWQPVPEPHQRRIDGGPGDLGIITDQQFATPQLALVTPQTYKDPRRFELPAPGHLNSSRAYRQAVDEVLRASARLTDEQKVKAEFFEHTPLSLTLSPRAAAIAHDLDLDGWAHLFLVTSVARFDSLIAAWHHKRTYDSARPLSAVRHVYGRKPVTAWGGVGQGTVHDIPADQWTGYLPVSNHPEYPSAFTTLCAAQAQAARTFLGDDVLDWTHSFAAGSTQKEPGIVPAADLKLTWATWSDFEKDCAKSRVWAGAHFTKTVENSLAFGTQFGDLAHEFVQRHISGDVED
ncbi:vanadium-dependent haloperoxidase [Streptomyces sp. NPDC057877]|uniref:vanadium-dependent haloperoxidase n=1 Tax=Streptomyces sp. NPDC057877 TaxID=3346269 RepID=UPI00368166EC